MLNRILKFFLIALTSATLVYEFTKGNIGNGIMYILLDGVLILLLFKHEANLLAFFQIRRNKFNSARTILAWVKKPEQLPKKQQAYHYFLNGLVESQSNSMGKSEKHFKKALNTGLNMNHDIAMANLNLAGIAMAKRRKREALNYIAQAKKHDKAKLLSDQIKMLKSQMGRI